MADNSGLSMDPLNDYEDIEDQRALEDIKESLAAAKGAVKASENTVVNINKANDEEVEQVLLVAQDMVAQADRTVRTLKGEPVDDEEPLLKKDIIQTQSVIQ